ncbi:MAG: hypothetical protein KAS85_07645 [Rhodobacteraceae bacterium]|nr:hypothetical protein [Paracoccaceae bacterium]
MSEILVKLEVAQGRRMFGVLSIAALGMTLLYIAAVYPPAIIPALFALILVGALFIWAGYRLYRSTDNTILLTREAITTQSGHVLCRLEDIAKVDRGFFAFKPSNGFLVLLKERGERSWSPGMWWHLGKHLGIGGVTSPRQSKEMVSIIQIILAEMKAAEADSK